MNYRPQLDTIRAFAALAIVFRHNLPSNSEWQLRLVALLAYGVRFFFVLSGFLITGILLDARDEGEQRGEARIGIWWRFWLRRVLRLFPLYYATLAAAYALNVPFMRQSLPWHLAYLSNVWMALKGSWVAWISPLWSLAVEEQFYIVWPFLILWVRRSWLPGVIGAGIAAGPIWRGLFPGSMFKSPNFAKHLLLPGCIDQLSYGALLAWLGRYRKNWQRPVHFVALCCLAIALWDVVRYVAFSGKPPADYPLFHTAFAVVAGALIEKMSRGFTGIPGKIAEWPPLVYLGKISYGIYLLHHVLVPTALRELGFEGPRRGWSTTFVVTWATISLAMLSWRFFEAPLLSLKRYVPYIQPNQPSAKREAPSEEN